ncbi:MAG: GGDEF domain-containing protein [bacterium]|nr:GGDEF domain-containing protein [bacterium]
MAEVQEVEIADIDKETAEKSIDPRLDEYTHQIYERFAKKFPEFTPEQLERLTGPSREEASERIKAEDSADNDPLTDLPNKRGLYRAMDLRLQQYHREIKSGKKKDDIKATFLYFDLDGLKTINDTYDHQTGDQVLSVFGQLLQTSLRPTDLVGRLGGDEFAALVDASLEEAIEVGERVREDLPQSFNDLFPKLNWPKSVSIGIRGLSNLNEEQLESEENRMALIKQSIHEADIAHYQGAKHVGKNRIGVMLDNGQVQTAIVNVAGAVGQPPTISYGKP